MGLAQSKPKSKRKYTIAEYLEMERAASERSEYIKCKLKLEDVYDRVGFSDEAIQFMNDIKNAK